MNAARAEALAMRRQLLLARVALQRVELQCSVQALELAASPMHRIRRWAADWREHPSRVLLFAGALVALRRIGLRRVARLALTAWQMWRTMGFSGAARWP
ncbi:MAG TPA: hypothetical protein VGQ91_02900 [Ideonella sp.]|nr:hypothetical protein [Ideonella sp.]